MTADMSFLARSSSRPAPSESSEYEVIDDSRLSVFAASSARACAEDFDRE